MASAVVGRSAELAAIEDFVAGVSAGAGALVLEGVAAEKWDVSFRRPPPSVFIR